MASRDERALVNQARTIVAGTVPACVSIVLWLRKPDAASSDRASRPLDAASKTDVLHWCRLHTIHPQWSPGTLGVGSET